MLHNLPPEILYLIANEMVLSKVEQEQSRYDLRFACDWKRECIAPLSMACHRLRSVLTPVLFRKLCLRNNGGATRAIDDKVEALEKSLAVNPNVIHVRHLDFQFPNSGSITISGLADLISRVLDYLPALRNLRMLVGAIDAFDARVLRAIERHGELKKVTVFALDLLSARVEQTALLSQALEGKLHIESAMFDERSTHRNHSDSWLHVLRVTVAIRQLYIHYRSLDEPSPWLRATFTGLRDLSTRNAFPTVSLDSTDISTEIFDDFVKRHPSLETFKCRIGYTTEMIRKGWSLSPLIGPVFLAFRDSPWDLELACFSRTHESQPFRCVEANIRTHSVLGTSGSIVSPLRLQSCMDIRVLHVTIYGSGVAPQDFVSFASSTAQCLLRDNVPNFEGLLSTIFMSWSVQSDDREAPREFTQLASSFETALEELTSEMASAFPKLTEVYHGVVLHSQWMTQCDAHFRFNISRSLVGNTSVKLQLEPTEE